MLDRKWRCCSLNRFISSTALRHGPFSSGSRELIDRIADTQLGSTKPWLGFFASLGLLGVRNDKAFKIPLVWKIIRWIWISR